MKKTKLAIISLFVLLLIVVRIFWFEIGLELFLKRHNQLFKEAEQGFVLYLDSSTDECSACFSEILVLEQMRSAYEESRYTVIIGDFEQDSEYYDNWIRENVFNGYEGPSILDCDNTFRKRYKLSDGSKILFFNYEGELVTLFRPQEKTLKEYLVLFKNHWQ